ncbi:delta 8-(E)-sphingolipid desaturase [Cordyceps fumosorosea ARSEF 2679]|uniref:Delta 8-(E)-sphingolipid desaturase n=1 Tax=Cordyceps fumosorosea (strain ARSEF 2679) TaxID=1081104 RepID=A0A167HIP2_CORFA|nr:delta 8-(E)-sphingolipid desaturase [Cordyceps fumosorosea ARSEF 2679]OAA47959.1 delta 8-(E)-sphingolipid desaturase [Cordyceps fumosorosea ARSEF 2679]
MGRDTILSRTAIEAMVANGDAVVIFQDYVLRLNSWLSIHPGGDLAIRHMIGRDATSEITLYHAAHTLQTMKAFRIGRKPTGPWTNMTPPIRAKPSTDPSSVVCVPPAALAEKKQGQGFDTFDVAVDSVPDDSPLSEKSAAGSASAADQCLQTGRQLRPTTCCSRRPSPSGVDATEPLLPPPPATAVVVDEKALEAAQQLPPPRGRKHMSPAQYTEWAMQQQRETDMDEYPSLAQDVQLAITDKYMKLHEQIEAEGLYECPYGAYAKEMVRYTALFAVSMYALHEGWYVVSALFLGLFWHQIMFTAHDAGHRAITQIFEVDTLIGMFIADFCCGLSIGWWKSSHNVHHLITNQPEHDPDIQNVPLFATCPSFFKSLRSTYYDFTFVWDRAAELLVPWQKYTYYPVMGIARFNLYLLSWIHVLLRPSQLGGSKAWWIRPAEAAFMACYWFLFGYLLLLRTLPDWRTRVLYVLVSHITTMPLHVQITLSHWGMSTAHLGEDESFPQRQLRTTMDVDCPAWLDWVHGGLQFQAVHHLFPRVPRHNLRRVQGLVRRFCDETGIPYAILGFADGNKKVLGRLDEVAEQVRILVSCQNYMAETGESGLH